MHAVTWATVIFSCIKHNGIICAYTHVTNLSYRTLTESDVFLLSRGLSFVPKARDSSHFELLRDFDVFCNKL